jgi:hypothetical protein
MVNNSSRERISINENWRFHKYDRMEKTDKLMYNLRPEGDPGNDLPSVHSDFDDSSLEKIDLPHDWAIQGPFLQGENTEVGGGMGRLPGNGVAWYRKKLDIPDSDKGKLPWPKGRYGEN